MNTGASVSLSQEAGPCPQLPQRMLCQVAMATTGLFGQAACEASRRERAGSSLVPTSARLRNGSKCHSVFFLEKVFSLRALLRKF